jgi:type IV secretory pathway VirB10-like protein
MADEPIAVPSVTDKRLTPPGILPRNTQPLVLGAVAVVMVIVIFFSGRSNPKPHASTTPGLATQVLQPNEDKLIGYKRRIDDEARKFKEEQEKLDQARKAWAIQPPLSPGSGGPGMNSYGSPGSEPPQQSWVEQEKEKREYLARFASNIVQSDHPQAQPANGGAALAPAQNLPPVDPRLYPWPFALPPGTQLPQPAGAGSAEDAKPADRAEHGSKTPPTDLNRSQGKDYRLFEGTIIETVLTNRLDGTFSGPVNCMVSYDVYSHDHIHVLIPSGSRVLGDVHPVQSSGQQRLAVTFHRLIMPDGFSVNLDQFHGLDQIGETGLRDQVNHHYMQIFGASIAIGMIAGLAQSNTQYGSSISASDAYRQGVASSLAQSSMQVLDRFLNILPTFTIREGQRVKIYLAEDLALPAYENHQMPDDI